MHFILTAHPHQPPLSLPWWKPLGLTSLWVTNYFFILLTVTGPPLEGHIYGILGSR